MSRLLSLDVLRGIAVLLVIISHADAFERSLLSPLHRGGWIGVDLFFVLSGFLVSGLLFREHQKAGTLRPVRFLVRRAWKIYPAFWVFIAYSVVAMPYKFDWHRTLVELCFLQSYSGHRWWGHTWSLAVEEHFYVLLPLLLVGLASERFKSLPRIVLWIMVGLCLARSINCLRPFSYMTHYFPTHLRLDGLFFGVLLSYWHHYRPEFNAFCRRNAKALITVGVVLLAPGFVWDIQTTPLIYSVGFTAQALGSGALLMGLVCGGLPDLLVFRGLAWIGTYSYSIYLWHRVALMMLASVFGIDDPLWSALVAGVILGAGMARLVEVPMLNLRDLVTPAFEAPPAVSDACLHASSPSS